MFFFSYLRHSFTSKIYDSNTNNYKYVIIGLINILAYYRQRVNLHLTFEFTKNIAIISTLNIFF